MTNLELALQALLTITVSLNAEHLRWDHPSRFSPGRLTPRIAINGEEHSICENFDDMPHGCRGTKGNECVYICASGSCRKRPPGTSCGGFDVQEERCASHCFDMCTCKQTKSCDFDVTTRSCIPKRADNACTNETFDKNECRREKAFYISGGTTCFNTINSGNCEIDRVVIAVNLGGGVATDERGLSLSGDAQVGRIDPHNVGVPSSTSETLKEDVPKIEHQIFSHYLKGKSISHPTPDKCVMYQITIDKDGMYELTLFLMEPYWTEPAKRTFNIYFNEVPILQEIDLLKVLNGKNSGGKFILNFLVSSVHGTYHKLVIFKGFSKLQYIINQVTMLKFCYGSCLKNDANFVVSAFSLVQFKPGDGGGTLPTPPPAPKRPPCETLSGQSTDNICECKLNGCEYNIKTGTCEKGSQVCNEAMFKPNECVREGFFYVLSGVVCRSYADRGNCKFKRIHKALNLNGGYHIGEKLRDPFVPEMSSDYSDPAMTRQGRTTPPFGHCGREYPVKGIPFNDTPIYTNFVYGSSDRRKPGRCLTYFIPFTEDGAYQLLLRMYEPYWNAPGKRLFTVKFQGTEVLKEVDLYVLNKDCRATNFLINFYIRDRASRLKVRGHQSTNLDNKRATLEFCYGSCSVPDPNFIASAFTVLQMEGSDEDSAETLVTTTTTEETPKPMEEPSTSTTTTTTSTTEMTTDASTTTMAPPREDCEKFDDNPCDCFNKPPADRASIDTPCNYDESTGLCTWREQTKCFTCSSASNDCRRDGAYYVDGGIVCLNRGQRGNCQSERIGGVSFGTEKLGEIKTDRYGISLAGSKFRVHDTIGGLYFDYRLPQRNTITDGQKYVCNEPDGRMRTITDLNGLLAEGAHEIYCYGAKGKGNNCLKVRADITKDGIYELSLKLTTLDKKNFTQTMRVRVNGELVLRHFNPFPLVKTFYQAMDLNINFQIRDQQRTFHLKGFEPRKLNANKKLELEVCTGECGDGTSTWVVGGVTLVRFINPIVPPRDPRPQEDMDKCGTYVQDRSHSNENICSCKTNNCEYDVTSGACSGRRTQEKGGCGSCLFGAQECRRRKGYYLNGGVLCYQDIERGYCYNKTEGDYQYPFVNAINFNSNGTEPGVTYNIKDSRMIPYFPDSAHTCMPVGSKYIQYTKAGGRYLGKDEENRVTQDQESVDRINIENAADKPLYAFHIFGPANNDNKDSAGCINCPISLDVGGDGGYELAIRVGDFYYENPGFRTFNFKFNGVFIVRELDILGVTKDFWTPIDITLNFIVTKNVTKLHMKGYPPSTIRNGKVNFSFCFGGCRGVNRVTDNHWHISAYSVVKFDFDYAAGGYSLLDHRTDGI